MTMVETLINKELNRNQNMLDVYFKELEELPKGTISEKKVKTNKYYYLKYRQGQKVISKYIGRNEEDKNNIEEQLARRKHIENMIKVLKEERNQLEKVGRIL